MDVVETRNEDLEKRRYYLATLDHATRRPRGGPMHTKEVESVWPLLEILYPGSRVNPAEADPDVVTVFTDFAYKKVEENGVAPLFRYPPFLEQFGMDGDPLWNPVHEKLQERGARIRSSEAERSESNAVIERWIQELEKGTGATMLHANMPAQFWSRAARTFKYNYEKSFVNTTGPFAGKTPFEATWAYEYQGQLLVFGCEISFLAKTTERDKLESRGKRGVFLTYGSEGSIEVLDFDEFRATGTYRTLMTRDWQADRTSFPFKNVRITPAGQEQVFNFVDEETLAIPEDIYEDANGVKRCRVCDKVAQTQPVTCGRCLRQLVHGRGRRGVGCRHGRCPGHIETGKEEASGEQLTEALVEQDANSDTASPPVSPRPIPGNIFERVGPRFPAFANLGSGNDGAPTPPPTTSRTVEISLLGVPMLSFARTIGTGAPAASALPAPAPPPLETAAQLGNRRKLVEVRERRREDYPEL